MTAASPAARAPGPARAPAATRGRALPRASIGSVPIVWNNADVPDLAPVVPAHHVLDAIARLGYLGTQTGIGYPTGDELRGALAERGLRLAEVYAALPCTADGPADGALAEGRARLADLHAAGGEVLVAALAFSPQRLVVSGRAAADGVPQLTGAGWRALGTLLDTLGSEARTLGHPLAFHSHTGTFVETHRELDRLLAETDPAAVGVCLDVGHYTVGGGDPVEAIEGLGDRIVHVHLKDVAAAPLERLRRGELGGFLDALRARLFTELGNGVLDVPGIVDALVARDYAGWLMVEQDTTWLRPEESAAIGIRVLEYQLGHAAGRAAEATAAARGTAARATVDRGTADQGTTGGARAAA